PFGQPAGLAVTPKAQRLGFQPVPATPPRLDDDAGGGLPEPEPGPWAVAPSGSGARGCLRSNDGRVLGSPLSPKPAAFNRHPSRPLLPAPFASISTSWSPARLGEQYESR